MNSKGFTLVELLAIIVLIGFISIIVYTSGGNIFGNAKKSSEVVFRGDISKQIEAFISLNGSGMGYDDTNKNITKTVNGISKEYDVYVSRNSYTLNDIISMKLISAPIINPNGERVCNLSSSFRVYRDEEMVYCFITDNWNCLTGNAKIDTCNFGW